METCVTPARVALLGSGGRAALALLGLRRDIELHTFHPAEMESDLAVNFNPLGVGLTVYASPHRHTFEYLHPLARPRIVPLPTVNVARVDVEAIEVLRFGCLEGDFRVTAKAAVYDPQSGARPTAFRDNGSTAHRLALVLNAEEIRRLTGEGDLGAAAALTMRRDRADAVIVKDGPIGAYVLDQVDGVVRHVPAYPTRSVYKIGSGDVFSATFAHFWLAGEASAADAADLASRRTADYVESPVFPLPHSVYPRAAGSVDTAHRTILLAQSRASTSGQWLLDQAARALRDLGATVLRHDGLSPRVAPPSQDAAPFDAVLLLLHGADDVLSGMRAVRAYGKPVVTFADDPAALEAVRALGFSAEDDFCSALYRTHWIAT